MQAKEKLEKDYKNSISIIEHMAEEGMRKIREQTTAIEKEAVKIGEDVESSINKEKATFDKKKS